MGDYLVIATSLRDGSRSRLVARALADCLGNDAEFLKLGDHPLPLCDGEAAYEDPNVSKLSEKISAARVIILATPIYNFDANAAAKNLIELTGGAWENKIVGFACAAGGRSSYMSIMSLANSLMLDFRCLIIPRFIYATGEDFNTKDELSADLLRRVEQMAEVARSIRYLD